VTSLRGWTVVFTSVLSMILLAVIFAASVWIMVLTGTILLPFVSTDAVLTLKGNLEILSTIVPVVVCVTAIILEFAGSSVLLRHKFQED
jgi:hypothetical protein